MGIVALISSGKDNDLAPPSHRPIVLSSRKSRKHTIGTGRGERRYCLIWSRQQSRSRKAQTYRSLVKKTQKTHNRHGPWGTSLLPYLVETTISLPQGTDPSHFYKTNQNSTRQARAVGDVVIVSFDRENDPAPPRHIPIAFSQI